MQRLKRLLDAKGLVRILEAHSGLTGIIVEHTSITENQKNEEFDGMWLSSLTDSTAKGKPDIEVVDSTSRLQTINEILEVTTKPIVYDGDSGGIPEHFGFLVRTLERLGVSATIIEDKIGQKRNSLFGTDVKQTQDDISSFCVKIAEGKRAQVTDDFMVIARIESLILGKGIADALQRTEAYIGAGADGIMIHSREKTGEEIIEFSQQFRRRGIKTCLVAVPSAYSHISEADLRSLGFNMVIYANHLLRSSYPAMVKTAETILRFHRAKEAEDNCMSISDIINLIPGR